MNKAGLMPGVSIDRQEKCGLEKLSNQRAVAQLGPGTLGLEARSVCL